MAVSAPTETTQEKLKSGYDTLLMDYAAGTLDETQTLVVAAHLTYSQKARDFIKSCESIGGALIEEESPSDMNAGSLQSVLDRLESAPKPQTRPTQPKTPTPGVFEFELPEPLRRPFTDQKKAPKWQTIFPHIKSIEFPVDCKTTYGRFVKIAPGHHAPEHRHTGTEITLVLDGAFHDETGSYEVGDLIVTDETFEHEPIACEINGCVCLIVQTAPIKLTGIKAILNPFLKT